MNQQRLGISTSSTQYKGYDKIADALRGMTYEKVLKEKRVAIGNPESVIKRFKELSEYFGIHQFSLQMNFGNMKYEHALNSVRLLGEKVIPAFSKSYMFNDLLLLC